MFLGELRSRPLDAGGGVVDEDIEAAEGVTDLLEQMPDLVGLSKVRLNLETAYAQCSKLPLSLGRGFVVTEVVESDVRSVTAQFQRDRLADPPGTSGDEGYLAYE